MKTGYEEDKNTNGTKIRMELSNQAPENKPKKPLSAYIYFS